MYLGNMLFSLYNMPTTSEILFLTTSVLNLNKQLISLRDETKCYIYIIVQIE